MNNVQGVSGAKLAEYLNVSSRTIRNDIGEINNAWKDGTLIQSSKKSGYSIDEQYRNQLTEYLLSDNQSNSDEMTDRGMVILGIVLERGNTDLYDLEEEMGLSQSAVYKEVIRLQKKLLSEYQSELLHMSAERIWAEGDEKKIRQLMFHLVKNEVQNGTGAYAALLQSLMGHSFEQQQFDGMVRLVKEYFDGYMIQISDANLYMISSALYITRIRNESNHRILSLSGQKEIPEERAKFYKYLREKKLELSGDDLQILGELLHGFKLTANPVKDSDIDSVNRLILEDFCREVMEKYHFDLWQSPVFYDNVLIHIEYMMRRIETGYAVRNPILNEVKKQYPYAYEISMLLVPIVYRYKNLFIQDDEISYIAIFIEHFLENVNQKLKTVIITSARFSVNSIIGSWVEKNFQNQLEIVKMLPQHNLDQYLEDHQVDLIISTGAMMHPEIATYKMDSLPTHYTQVAIDTLIHKIRMNYRFREIIKEHFDEDMIRIYREKVEFDQVIVELSQDLEEKGYIYDAKEYSNDVLQREINYPTYIGDWFMIPHPLVTFAKKTSIGVAVLKKPIRRQEKEIQLIFLLALESKQNDQIGILFQFLRHIALEKSSINSLTAVENGSELIKELIRISNSTDDH